MIPLPALIAEIRAAGPGPELKGDRVPRREIGEMEQWLLDADPFRASRRVGFAIHQLRADLVRLAVEVERVQDLNMRLSP